jgi:hypothetical protein
MMRVLFVAAALAWTIAASGPAAARDGQAVTMRAVLYEEDASNAKGDRAEGQVTWRIEPTTDAAAPAGDVTIRGDVEVPSRKLRMTLSIRRNFDATLPATHTMQIDFAPSLDFAGGSINRVMGLLMKVNEQAKGAPIAALSVKVDDRHFLIGLSAVPQDASNNSLLIRSRAWMDIPIVYATQRRAILAVEKDGDVLALFNTVFAH